MSSFQEKEVEQVGVSEELSDEEKSSNFSPASLNAGPINNIPGYEEVAEAVRTTGYLTYREEKALLRKIDWRLLPLLCSLYLIKNCEQNTVSYIVTMNSGTEYNVLSMLDMTHNQWSWVATAFFIPFVLFEIPSTLLLKYSTPRIHHSRIGISWGIITLCHAAVKNKEGLYAVRFFLGMMTAGLFPAMLAQLTYWYRPDEQATRMALLGVLGSFSDFVVAFLSYGYSYISGKSHLAGWQWLYITEGIICLIVSVFIFFFLPNFPDDTKWLTDKEKAFLVSRLPNFAPKATDKNFSWTEIKRGLARAEGWLFTLLKLFQLMGTYGLTFWLTTVIKGFGLASPTITPLLTLPVTALAVISGIGFAFFVDYGFCSPFVLAFSAMICTCGTLIALTVVTNKAALYVLILLSSLFSNADGSVMSSWMSISVKGTSEVEVLFAMSNGVAQLAKIFGPHIFSSKYSPRYSLPFGICILFVGLTIFCIIAIQWRTGKKTAKLFKAKRAKLANRKKDLDEKPIYDGTEEEDL